MNIRDKVMDKVFGKKYIDVHGHKVHVPRDVYRFVKKSNMEYDKLIDTIMHGDWAMNWARAMCLPDNRKHLPWKDLTEEEKECILRYARHVAEKLASG